MIDNKLPYGYGLSFWTRIKVLFRRINVKKWTYIFYAASIIPGWLYASIRGPVTVDRPTNFLDLVMATNIGFCIGCIGFLWTFRQEAITKAGFRYYGKAARNDGIFYIIVGWGLALLLLLGGSLALLTQ